MLAGCATYHQSISSYQKIDEKAKTVAVDRVSMKDIYQDFGRALGEAGFGIYENGEAGARYKLSGDVHLDENVRCGLWETGYTYNITFIDNVKKTEVFSMEGQGCPEAVMTDFTALINNRYDDDSDKPEKPQDPDEMRAPNLRSDGRTWWAN